MERALIEACQAGNVDALHQLLRSNPFLLHSTAACSPQQNPFHVAAIAGHVDFTREMLKLKPEFAGEVNQDGLTALHFAAGNGHLEIVRELVKVNRDLCRVEEGRDGMTALHCAAMKGRVEVIGEILASCPGCVDDVTARRETALHLAVRNSQFGAVKVLTDWMAEKNKREALNFKDEQGNTVLHLAAWKKQRPVIELLLGNRIAGTLDANAMNHAGLTALDLMLMFPSEAGDREIIDILQAAGALRASAREIPTSQHSADHTTVTISNSTLPVPRRRTAEAKELIEYFKFKKGRDSPSEARSALLVIAVLVATATFQIGINPPGGVWQDTHAAGENTTADYTKPHIAGESVLASANPVAYSMVAVFNTIGFSTALLMINVLTKRFPLQLELQICMTAMYVAYNTSIITIAPDELKKIVVPSISILPILMGFAVHWARTVMYRIEQLVQRMTHRVP
ncbi:unnamed protein product [Linum tenue]|uniref:PGG domain-containing protein n=1 Tax=Linum tenue TaxID=586396 RepID=A0AAV0QS61_9ROSI|nr:unnamed protein product [Linum tenue]